MQNSKIERDSKTCKSNQVNKILTVNSVISAFCQGDKRFYSKSNKCRSMAFMSLYPDQPASSNLSLSGSTDLFCSVDGLLAVLILASLLYRPPAESQMTHAHISYCWPPRAPTNFTSVSCSR